jgi:hypothetical protein
MLIGSIWTHLGLFGLIISSYCSFSFVLCEGNIKKFGHFCVEVFIKIPSSSMKFESLHLNEFYKTLYTKRFTMEIRLECKNVSSFEIMLAVYGPHTLGLTQGKETGF